MFAVLRFEEVSREANPTVAVPVLVSGNSGCVLISRQQPSLVPLFLPVVASGVRSQLTPRL